MFKRVLLFTVLSVFFVSCSSDDDQGNSPELPLGAYDNVKSRKLWSR